MAGSIRFEPEISPEVSVIILAWKSAPYLFDCLASLQASVRRVRYEVVLVLNEPSAELATTVERDVEGATILRTRVNVGYGGAVNLAAQRSRGEFLVLLNDDAVVLVDWLEKLLETARRRPQAGAVGSTTLFPDGSIQEAGCVIWSDGSTRKVGRDLPAGSRRYDFERRVDFCSGSSLLVRRELWEKVGGMDAATYFPAYYEDTDLCLRLAEIGAPVYYQPRSYVRHQESASTNATYRAFLFAKNREVFVKRWGKEVEDREDPGDEAAVERAVWRAMGAPWRVLFIDDQIADPAIGSGYPRMAELFSSLQGSGRFQLSIFTSLIEGNERAEAMCELGVRVVDGSFEEDLRAHLGDFGSDYEAVVISRPHNYERFAPILRELRPVTPIIYDAEALFHRRIGFQAELTKDMDQRVALEREAAEMEATEAKIAADADHLVAISRTEAAFLAGHSRSPVSIHGPLLAGIAPSDAGFSEKNDIGFVAGWAGGPRSPNADALAWFVHEVLPGVLSRVPGARLLVTGSGPPEAALRFASPSVVFLGSLPDLARFYGSVRVVIVPMRYGAGVKNKTVEALQYGVPTVSTGIGADGIDLFEPEALLVTDDPDSFALKVASLLGDEGAWDLQRRRVLAHLALWQSEEAVWPALLKDVIETGRKPRWR